MTLIVGSDRALGFLHEVALGLVQETKQGAAQDLTLRQLAILLTIRLDEPPHTVRGLAKRLGVTKPVITRALDALGKQSILVRQRDEADRRNVTVQCTAKGMLYVDELGDMVLGKARSLA